MDSGRLIFYSSPSQSGHMLLPGIHLLPVLFPQLCFWMLFSRWNSCGFGWGSDEGARSFLVFEEGANKRLPFFTTAEELMEEEYYDEQIPDKKKRRLTAEQMHLLERSFEAENKLEPERKIELAKKLGLQPRQVAVWFQNRRARWKTKQLESDFDRLKSSYDALLAHRDSLLKDNYWLRSQVLSLMEKLREKEPTMAELQLSDQRGEEEMQELLSPPSSPLPALHLRREEDRLSTGSGGSAVIDSTEAAALLFDSSRESYFQDGVMGSDEDGGISVDGFSYLPARIFVEAAHEDNWWVLS